MVNTSEGLIFGPLTVCGEHPSGVSIVLNTPRKPLNLKGFYHDGTGFPAAAISARAMHPQ